MQDKITLNNGTVIENVHTSVTGPALFLYVRHPQMTMPELFDLFYNPQNTISISAVENGEEQVYEGYTDLYFMNKDERQICFGLMKTN